jgi:hypothetical protein
VAQREYETMLRLSRRQELALKKFARERDCSVAQAMRELIRTGIEEKQDA